MRILNIASVANSQIHYKAVFTVVSCCTINRYYTHRETDINIDIVVIDIDIDIESVFFFKCKNFLAIFFYFLWVWSQKLKFSIIR